MLGVLVVRQGDTLVRYAGPATPLIDLAAAGASPQERARTLRLVDGRLVADLIPFTYALQSSASSAPPLRRAIWAWDPAAPGWAVQQPARAGH